MLTATDLLGRVTRNGYTANGNLQSVTRNYLSGQPQNYQNLYNFITTYEYDSAGRLVKSTDTFGRINSTCYDSAGRVVKTIQNPSVADPCLSYTPSSDPALDRISETYYDADSNVIATKGSDGIITRTYYDTLNRPVTVAQNLVGALITDPNPPIFNSANPDRNVRSDTVYDNAGNVLKTIDNTGRIAYNCYDALNRVVKTIQNPSVTNPCIAYTPATAADQDITTQAIYDDVGNLIASVDPVDRITRTYYDPLNRPYVVVRNLTATTVSDPNPPFAAFTTSPADENIATQTFYDSVGRVSKTVDLNTTRAAWTCYDNANRVTRTVVNATVADPCLNAGGGVQLNAPTGPNNDENLSSDYVYDLAGRQIATVAPDGLVTRTYYDEADRRTATTRNLVYRLAGLVQPLADALALTTPPVYDNVNYPDENLTTRSEYDALGRVVKSIGAGASPAPTTWTCYDALGRVVKSIQNPSVANPCVTYAASVNNDDDVITLSIYDATGNLIGTTDAAQTNRTDRTYYDALHRGRYIVANLTGQAVTVTTPPTYTASLPDQNLRQEMKYDAAGRSFEVIDNAGMVTRSNYDLLDRAIAVITNYVSGGLQNNQTNLTTQTTFDKLGECDRPDGCQWPRHPFRVR